MKKEQIVRALAGVKEEARHKYRTEIKGFFGSYARGEEREGSDLDVLVEFQEGADLFDFVGIGLFLEEKLGIGVDIVPQKSIRAEIDQDVSKEAVYI